LPSLENLKKSFQNKPFKVLLISVMESQKTIKSYMKNENLSLDVLLDTFGRVSTHYNVRNHPIKLLIDGEGKLLATGMGYRDWDSAEMNQLVNILTRKPKA
jgi:hypothetical protein